jgi:hypothetical protein
MTPALPYKVAIAKPLVQPGIPAPMKALHHLTMLRRSNPAAGHPLTIKPAQIAPLSDRLPATPPKIQILKSVRIGTPKPYYEMLDPIINIPNNHTPYEKA